MSALPFARLTSGSGSSPKGENAPHQRVSFLPICLMQETATKRGDLAPMASTTYRTHDERRL